MTQTDERLNTTLILPTVLALLFVLISTAAVWFAQGQPAVADAGGEEATVAAAVPESEPAGDQSSAGDPAAGQQMFVQTCAACHGPQGRGIEGLGKDMAVSEFIATHSDAELVDFIKVGRDPSDPLNTTGVAMPPKGGNPSLTDEDLLDIVAYIREIQQ
jgi:disulfide bond formation protein DsbB